MLHFSDIATSRELRKRRLKLITSSRTSNLYSGRKLNNLTFESVGLAGVRRVDPLEVIQSPVSLTIQLRRHAYLVVNVLQVYNLLNFNVVPLR